MKRPHKPGCWAKCGTGPGDDDCDCGADAFNAGYEAGAKAEREACAAIADGEVRSVLSIDTAGAWGNRLVLRIAAAIRARSNPPDLDSPRWPAENRKP